MKCIFDILTSLKANTTTSLTFTLGVKRDTCYFSKIILYRNVRSSTTVNCLENSLFCVRLLQRRGYIRIIK